MRIWPRDPLDIASALNIPDKVAIRRLYYLFENGIIKATSTIVRLSPKPDKKGNHPRQKIRFYVHPDFPTDRASVVYRYFDPRIGRNREIQVEVEVGFRDDIPIEPRDGTDIVFEHINKLHEAPSTIEIANSLEIPKGRIASILQTLVRSGRIKQYHHLNKKGEVQKLLNGHLYYTDLKQVIRRLQRPESLLDKQMGKVAGVVAEKNRRGFPCYFGDIEQELKIPRHLLKAHLRRIDKLALGLQKISVEGRTCYYFLNLLDDEKVKSAKEAVITSDISQTEGLLSISSDEVCDEILDQSSQYGNRLIDDLNSRPIGTKPWFLKLSRIIKINGGGPSDKTFHNIFVEIDLSELKRILGAGKSIKVSDRDVSMLLIDFHAGLSGFTRIDFLEKLESSMNLMKACHLVNRFIPSTSTVTKFRNRVGHSSIIAGYEYLRDHILKDLDLGRLTISDYGELLERHKIES